MLVKFLVHGTGSARKAADYLLRERDATGKPRKDVEVLRGGPHQVAAVADTLAFDRKYTSGVVARAPEDEPTDEQIDAVLDAFEERGCDGQQSRYGDGWGPPCIRTCRLRLRPGSRVCGFRRSVQPRFR